jgi:hypothetical protein
VVNGVGLVSLGQPGREAGAVRGVRLRPDALLVRAALVALRDTRFHLRRHVDGPTDVPLLDGWAGAERLKAVPQGSAVPQEAQSRRQRQTGLQKRKRQQRRLRAIGPEEQKWKEEAQIDHDVERDEEAVGGAGGLELAAIRALRLRARAPTVSACTPSLWPQPPTTERESDTCICCEIQKTLKITAQKYTMSRKAVKKVRFAAMRSASSKKDAVLSLAPRVRKVPSSPLASMIENQMMLRAEGTP